MNRGLTLIAPDGATAGVPTVENVKGVIIEEQTGPFSK
jgi:hypothetical protein